MLVTIYFWNCDEISLSNVYCELSWLNAQIMDSMDILLMVSRSRNMLFMEESVCWYRVADWLARWMMNVSLNNPFFVFLINIFTLVGANTILIFKCLKRTDNCMAITIPSIKNAKRKKTTCCQANAKIKVNWINCVAVTRVEI